MRRWLIGLGVLGGALFVALVAAATTMHFYDKARSDRLAAGVVVAGVDVGGLRSDEARARVRQALLPRLQRPLTLAYGRRSFVIRPARAGVRVDVDGMVARALAASRRGSLFHRFMREVRDRPLHLSVPLAAAYSRASVVALAGRVARVLDRPARSATVSATATSVATTPSRAGLAVRARLLVREVAARILDPHAGRTVAIPVRSVRPRVTTGDLPRRYPAFITVSRETYTLRLFRGLKLYRSYRIAVGRAGLETPAGLYRIDDKQVNPSWHVPNSPWAGSLAGRVIPPGPDDPIKARWLGFYNGAGIHGTEDVASLGSAASHGCIRMSIPDVIELYDLVPWGTPIYVG